MDAGDTGNGGVGGETSAGCLIYMHFYRRIDGVAVHANLGHIGNNGVIMRVCGVCFSGVIVAMRRALLALRAAAVYFSAGFGSHFP